MEGSSFTNITNETDYFDKNTELLDSVSKVMGSYVSSIICLIGLVINISLLAHINKHSFRHKMYDTVRVCTIIDLLICIIGIGYNNSGCTSCLNTKLNTQNALFYQWFIINVSLRGFLIASALAEINLILNRYLIISNIEWPFIRNLSKKKMFTIMFLVSFLMFMVPTYLTIEIVPVEEGFYTWTLSDFGKNKFVPFFFIFQMIFDTVIPILLLVILTVLSVVRFEKFALYKKVTLERSYYTKSNRRFSAIVIVMTCVFILTRSIDMIGIVGVRMMGFGFFKVTQQIHSEINFFRMISMVLTFTAHSFNGLLFFAFDKNLNRSVRASFRNSRFI